VANNDARTPTATGSFGTLLHPLTEENETTEAVADNGTVMAATMTDIQAAIDQLGQHRNDDGRSMSFASTRDDRGSEVGHDLDDDDLDGEEWHRDARRRLFEGLNAVDGRHATPPVDVEMSDESDADDEHHSHHNHNARPAHSPPKETHSMKQPPRDTHAVLHRSPSPLPPSDHSSSFHQPSTLEDGPKANVPPSDAPELLQVEIDLRSPSRSPATPLYSKELAHGIPTPTQSNTRPTTPNVMTLPIQPMPDSLSVPSISHTPSATTLKSYRSAPALPQPSLTIPETNSSRIYSTPPTSNLPFAASPSSAPSSAPGSALVPPWPAASTVQSGSSSAKKAHPSEWTIEQVVEWARNRGFDESVCAKFQGSFFRSLPFFDIVLEMTLCPLHRARDNRRCPP
jgi:hypothetical protein